MMAKGHTGSSLHDKNSRALDGDFSDNDLPLQSEDEDNVIPRAGQSVTIGRLSRYKASAPEIWIYTITGDAELRCRRKRKKSYAPYRKRTVQENLLAACHAYTRAKELSVAFRRPDIHNGPIWVILWGGKGKVFLYTPRPDGVQYCSGHPVNPFVLSRAAAILVLDHYFDSFRH